LRLALDGCEHGGITHPRSGRSALAKGANPMDLVTLVTACALAVDPKLMHALVWHQSGGEPWAVSVQGEPSPRVYSSLDEAIRETRASSIAGVVRVGLAGLSVSPSKVAASVLLPCRNVAMAAVQIAKHASRCKAHPRLKADPTFCAVAVYRGSWEQPDLKFATDIATSVAKGVTRRISTCRRAPAPRFSTPRPIRPSTQILPPSTLPMPSLSARVAGQARCFLQSPSL
jgi:hypothetical protein